MTIGLSCLAGAGWRFTDANGDPISTPTGGGLYIYAAGTTTPASTWTDSGGGTPNANPIVLANGQPTYLGSVVEVWGLVGTRYKLDIKDNNGASVPGWPQDNIGVLDDQLRTLLFGGSLGLINVKAYGAVGNGVTDDTAAIDTASAAARAAANGLFFPAGNYIYNGAGLYGHPVQGAGTFITTVTLSGTGSFFVSPPGPAITGSLEITELTVTGGFGLVRLTYTGANSAASIFRVENFRAYGCSGPAISSLASDHPYWKIRGLVHYLGGGPAGSMGVALAGLTDACEIDLDVTGAAIAVKLGRSGPNARVRGSFVRSGAYSTFPRVDIWLVPEAASLQGQGGDIQYRFGNENKSAANDYHILVADQDTGAGTDFATYLPKLSADSTGFSGGWSVSNSMFSDTGSSPGGPVIYSTTPNLQGVRVGPIIINTARPNYIIQYRTVPTPNELFTTNLIGPIVTTDRDAPATSVVPSNAKGTYVLIDADGQLSRFAETPLAYTGGNSPSGWVGQLATLDFAAGGTTTSTPVTDAAGGDDALELTYLSNALGNAFATSIALANVVLNKPMWVEFDLAPGSSSSLVDLQVMARYGAGTGAVFWREYIPIPTAWATYRFQFTPSAAANNLQFLFLPQTDAAGGKVQIGRVRVYQGREARSSGFVQLGQSAALGTTVLRANSNTTAVGNVGGGEDTLITYSLPAKALRSTGQGFRITAWGTAANNANAKTLKAYFGTVAMLTATLTVSVAGKWWLTGLVFRTGTSAQDYFAQCTDSGATSATLANGSLTQTETNAITIKCTGTATADNDIVQEGMLVEMLT